jgi:meso-butanediol dehydrogenase/(S,S)-butanediol dehydrogenase/diacetyl reductase
LVLADVQTGPGEDLAAAIRGGGGTATFHHTDVTKASAVDALITGAAARLGRIDILVNNAGNVGEFAPTVECTEDNWDFLNDLNVKSAFLGAKYALPVMLRQGGGSIVNVSSGAGLVGFPGRPAYSAAKAGIVGFTRTAALEYAAQGVRVNCVCPGSTLTPMLQGLETLFPGRHDFLRERVPMRRLADPAEIAQAILFLASDEASYITGIALAVDGGVTAG